MAKRVRATGIPHDHAHIGQTLAHLRRYTGHQCSGCTLHKTCLDSPPPGGPWEILEAETERAVACQVNPNIHMVPVVVKRIKEDKRPPPAPQQQAQEEWHILLDANALIEGAKGTFVGLINLILEPPPGFHYHTTDQVADEVRFLRGVDRNIVFDHIEIHPAPRAYDGVIEETRGKGVNPPSPADMGLFQLAKQDPRFTTLVSSDRFHSWTGLAQTLGIADRLTVYPVDGFVKYARKKRR